MPVSTTQSWYTAAISAHEYFVEFSSMQSVCLLLLAAYYSYFIQMNVFVNACDVIHNVYLMQSEYIHASREWERERASYREQIDQLHV